MKIIFTNKDTDKTLTLELMPQQTLEDLVQRIMVASGTDSVPRRYKFREQFLKSEQLSIKLEVLFKDFSEIKIEGDNVYDPELDLLIAATTKKLMPVAALKLATNSAKKKVYWQRKRESAPSLLKTDPAQPRKLKLPVAVAARISPGRQRRVFSVNHSAELSLFHEQQPEKLTIMTLLKKASESSFKSPAVFDELLDPLKNSPTALKKYYAQYQQFLLQSQHTQLPATQFSFNATGPRPVEQKIASSNPSIWRSRCTFLSESFLEPSLNVPEFLNILKVYGHNVAAASTTIELRFSRQNMRMTKQVINFFKEKWRQVSVEKLDSIDGILLLVQGISYQQVLAELCLAQKEMDKLSLDLFRLDSHGYS